MVTRSRWSKSLQSQLVTSMWRSRHQRVRALLLPAKLSNKSSRRDAVVYGVNTGFGKLSDVRVPKAELRQLQLNLVRSHACGIGQPLSEPEVRAMMLLRANVLTLGFSGIRSDVIELLCEMLNRRLYPVVPEKGSVGASGDLAPLAHLALSVIGEGEVFFEGQRMATAEALRRAKLKALSNWKRRKVWPCSTAHKPCTR